MHIPEQMTAVILDTYSGVKGLSIGTCPVPKPSRNEVLVKVAASPINPSDLAFLEGQYGFQKATPVIPGFEGSGTVVAVGEGIMGRYLLGKRVACISQAKGNGVWADYMMTSINYALPLNQSVSLEQGAMSAVNPLTALAFLELAKKGGHKAIIQTAAASALGQMLNRLCQRESIKVINIVRRDEQAELLIKQGATIVLNSAEANFLEKLPEICHQHKTRLAFDAVAGSLTMQLLDAMPPDSKVIVYGGLASEPAQAPPGQLIFQNKSVEGFWLTHFLAKKTSLQNLMLWRRAQKLISTELKSEIRAEYRLDEAKQAILEYQGQMTGGKILLKPNQ